MLKIKPVFSEKIWGGNKLVKFGFDTPSSKTGEAWLISGYKGKESRIEGESLNLQKYYEKYPEKFNNYPTKDFPLLVKIIDAREALSIQIHPDNKLAQDLEDYPFGKTECWYVLNHEKDAELIVGTKTTNKKEIKEFISRGEWDNIYNKIKSKKDLVMNINAGTIHAIGAGNLIYELQQSSDITYRFYDFDRLENGIKRELHVEKAIKCIKPDNDIYQHPKIFKDSKNFERMRIVDNKLFNLEKWNITTDHSVKFDFKKVNFLLVTNVETPTSINGVNLNKGESIILTVDDLKNEINLSFGNLIVGYPK